MFNESTDNKKIRNFREKIQNFPKNYIPGARFNSSGTQLFVCMALPREVCNVIGDKQ